MTTPAHNRTRNSLIWLVFLGLALRVFVPIGYMPAPLSAGGPFVLCPGAFFGASLFSPKVGGQDEEHGHAAHDDDSANAWESCPFGFVSGAFGPTSELKSSIPFLQAAVTAIDSDATIASASIRAHRARAPPAIQSLDA